MSESGRALGHKTAETRKSSGVFSVGDRVRLVGSHPWAGSSGTVVSSFTAAGLDWEIRLDDGDYPNHQVAAHEAEMRTERRAWR